ncbi:protein arginine N-methyltransferase 1.6-like [Pistacia vera]|uniref:protein arginine N-methyltransferase 1.6-like n=1 Tax=Pistacia vera TaxID=55513 RepID=UPI0012631AA1|nr:protein arginine N-methyltransferase 1.6-like [Pistacia vera]
MEFDFTKQISPCHGKAQVEFMESGICHGFALWIDWVIDAENKIVVSTGPDKRYWKQGVKLLASPVAVGIGGAERTGICCSTLVEASFDPSSGELNIQHTFS